VLASVIAPAPLARASVAGAFNMRAAGARCGAGDSPSAHKHAQALPAELVEALARLLNRRESVHHEGGLQDAEITYAELLPSQVIDLPQNFIANPSCVIEHHLLVFERADYMARVVDVLGDCACMIQDRGIFIPQLQNRRPSHGYSPRRKSTRILLLILAVPARLCRGTRTRLLADSFARGPAGGPLTFGEGASRGGNIARDAISVPTAITNRRLGRASRPPGRSSMRAEGARRGGEKQNRSRPELRSLLYTNIQRHRRVESTKVIFSASSAPVCGSILQIAAANDGLVPFPPR
jgi:hypothetical protein